MTKYQRPYHVQTIKTTAFLRQYKLVDGSIRFYHETPHISVLLCLGRWGFLLSCVCQSWCISVGCWKYDGFHWWGWSEKENSERHQNNFPVLSIWILKNLWFVRGYIMKIPLMLDNNENVQNIFSIYQF